MQDIYVTGMPYVPGVATGRLHRGPAAPDAHCIALVSPEQIEHLQLTPAGILVEEAAPFSHTLIGLLGLGVPTVLISAAQASQLRQGETIHVDASRGIISDRPSVVTVPVAMHPPAAGKAVSSADGQGVQLYASVRRPDAAQRAVQNGAGAIGLVRTEFLVPAHGAVPDTAFYQVAFREIAEAARPLAVTFRLLDVAADKVPPWLPGVACTGASLGRQGVRLYALPEVKKVILAQLEALHALSDSFDLRVLIPFLARAEELAYWHGFIRERLPDAVAVGAMVETPAGALDIAGLLARADFVAIGCNDLMQCLFAVDRDEPALRDYLDPYAPVLYRFLRQLIEHAGAQRERIQLCGVLSQLQGVLPVLLGLGFRTFSVDAPFIPYLAHTIERLGLNDCERLAEQICDCRETHEVRTILALPADTHPPFVY